MFLFAACNAVRLQSCRYFPVFVLVCGTRIAAVGVVFVWANEFNRTGRVGSQRLAYPTPYVR
jgi:hypothetical protein